MYFLINAACFLFQEAAYTVYRAVPKVGSFVEKRLYSGFPEAFKEAVSDAHINVCAVMKKRSIGVEVQYLQ